MYVCTLEIIKCFVKTEFMAKKQKLEVTDCDLKRGAEFFKVANCDLER